MTTTSRIGALLLSVGFILIVVDGFTDSWSVAQVIALVLIGFAIITLFVAGNRDRS